MTQLVVRVKRVRLPSHAISCVVSYLWAHGAGWDHVVTARGAIVSVRRRG